MWGRGLKSAGQESGDRFSLGIEGHTNSGCSLLIKNFAAFSLEKFAVLGPCKLLTKLFQTDLLEGHLGILGGIVIELLHDSNLTSG